MLFLCPAKLYPPSSGNGRRVLSIARSLSKKGHDVTVYSVIFQASEWRWKPFEKKLEDNLVVISSNMFSSELFKQLSKAELVQFEYPYLLPMMILMKILRRPFVLDEHGVEISFVRELKRIRKLPGEPRGPIGFLLKRLPFVEPLVFFIEKQAVRISSLVFACSTNDANEICSLYKTNRSQVMVVPNCADETFFEDLTPNRFEGPSVLFIGSFDHPPNFEGARIFLEKIVPRIIEEVGNALFVFVGRNPPSWLSQQRTNNFLVTGEVDDPRPFIKGADVTVIPIFSGSGTRQKAVDCLALGKAIVSTSKGVEGLDLEDGLHFIKADTVEAFSKAVVQLLKDRKKAEFLGSQAREIAGAKYAWKTQIPAVARFYKSLLIRSAQR